MPSSFNDLLTQILSTNPSLDRDKLVAMIEQKKQESHGLLSDEGAVRLVAQQLSISPLPSSGLSDQRISSVHAGLNNSTITGQVNSISEIREFQRSDGTLGKVLKMRISDGSGQITCVFWDNLAETADREALTPGSQLRLLHGYTKNGMGGEVEFHLGFRASIQILKRTPPGTGSPATPQMPVANIKANNQIRLRLVKLQKSQSPQGPTWALCSSESGLIIAKFWDAQAENILSLGEGALIIVHNHWTTEKNGMVYLNIGLKSSVEKESTDFVASIPESTIGSVKPGPVLWTISGKIVEKGEVREIETREGRRTRVSNIRLEDSTARIRVSLWDAHAEKAETLATGDQVRLVGVKVRENMNGEKEASTVFLTQFEKP
jgi:replication factor A1